jgi:hypothetical protein
MRSNIEPNGTDALNSDLRNLVRLLRVFLFAVGLLLLSILALLQTQETSRAQGGTLELSKTLNHASPVVRVGQVVSFTIAMTNNASFTLTNVTLG